jgi:hypothetical protein
MESMAKRAKLEPVISAPPGVGVGVGATAASPVLHVRGLPDDSTEPELLALAQQFGPVSDVMLMVGKGQGFAQYATREAAASAVQRATATPGLVRYASARASAAPLPHATGTGCAGCCADPTACAWPRGRRICLTVRAPASPQRTHDLLPGFNTPVDHQVGLDRPNCACCGLPAG